MAVHDVLFPVVLFRSERVLSTVLKRNIGELHQPELILVHIRIDGADVVNHDGDYFFRFRPAVLLHMGLEIFPRRAVQVSVRMAELLLVAVDGNAQTIQVHIYGLPHRIIVIDAVLVHFHLDGTGFVLQIDFLEDVA